MRTMPDCIPYGSTPLTYFSKSRNSSIVCACVSLVSISCRVTPERRMGGVTYRLEDGNVVFEVVRLDFGVLFSLCSGASSLFKSHAVLFIEDVVAEFGEGRARGCVIGFLMAGLVGRGRCVYLGRKEMFGRHVVLIHGSGSHACVGRHGSGGHGRRYGGGAEKTVRARLGDTGAEPQS